MSYSKQTWTDHVTQADAVKLGHLEDGVDAAHTAAGNAQASADAALQAIAQLGGDTGTVTGPTLAGLADVDMPARQVDALGNVIIPGPQDGDVATYDAESQRWTYRGVQFPDLTGVYQPYDPNMRFFVPTFIIDTANPAVPPDFPDGGIKFDELHPDAEIARTVNTVAASGAAQTIPDPGVASMSDITLTANCTLSFPAATAGASFVLYLKQDATGGRTVSWPTAAEFPTGTAAPPTGPTIASAANSVTRLIFESLGVKWRMVSITLYGASTAPTGTPPSLRGSAFGATTGTSNGSSVAMTLPTGIVSGDRGRVLVVRDGGETPTPGPTLTVPTGWTQVETQTTGGMTSWLLERNMVAGDSGTTLTIAFSAGARINVVGCVVQGSAATGEVRVLSLDSSVDASADVPAYTPPVDNCLVLVFSGIRFNSSTGPTVAPSSGSPLTELLEITEGRTASINFTAYLASRTLTGQGGLAQPADALALTGATAIDETYVVVLPPA